MVCMACFAMNERDWGVTFDVSRPLGASFKHRGWWKYSRKILPAGRLEQKQRSFVLPRRFSRWTLRKYNHLNLYPRMEWRTCRKRPLQVRGWSIIACGRVIDVYLRFLVLEVVCSRLLDIGRTRDLPFSSVCPLACRDAVSISSLTIDNAISEVLY